MNAWFSASHRLHCGLKEFSYGELLDGFELPVRAEGQAAGADIAPNPAVTSE